jgi:hypothetical protein
MSNCHRISILSPRGTLNYFIFNAFFSIIIGAPRNKFERIILESYIGVGLRL